MSAGILDLHDSNLQLWHQKAHVQSPGYALLQDAHYLFGSKARAAARLKPRAINTRYWWRLSTEALQPALGPARHTGDLAHAHLLQLHEQARSPSEVLVAASGSMQREQLALLLGIVQQCPFDAVGMVHRSVALGSLFPGYQRLFHIEMQLHQAWVSELQTIDNSVQLKNSTALPGCGLLQLQERVIEIIAAAFVRQTRFDPRRQASSEQLLYDTLPTVLNTLQQQVETNLDIQGYQARISAQQLVAAGQRLFDSIREAVGALDTQDALLVDPLAGLLPGMAEALEQPQVLKSDDIYHAVELHRQRLTQRAQALSFITTLPLLQANSAQPANPDRAAKLSEAVSAKTAMEPTHILQGPIAKPLIAAGTDLGDGCALQLHSDGWQLRGAGESTRINEQPYQSDQILHCGDVITFSKHQTYRIIRVID